MATKKDTTEEMTLEQMQEAMKAEMQKILDDAKAEAAKIIEEAKAGVAPSTISAEAKTAMDAYWNEYVDVKLFKDSDKYSGDVFVSVNGETCLIKRGERVRIKRKFAEVLDASDIQDYETAKLIERESSGDKYAGNV